MRAYGSPAVVVDPDNARRVFAAGVDFRTGACTFQSSRDGGTTWRQSGQAPSVPGSPLCLHNLGQMPTSFLSMGRDKALYWAHVASSIDDQPNLSVFLSRSTDAGETWTSAAVRDARGKRGAASERNIVMDLAVDTAQEEGDIVYVAWMAALPLATPSRARQAMVVSSLDGGRTFSDPMDPADSFFFSGAWQPAGGRHSRTETGGPDRRPSTEPRRRRKGKPSRRLARVRDRGSVPLTGALATGVRLPLG
ncbi:MAG: glycoside hydrolase [Actinomycetota bacterium]|nr:glycoside hydrolase [Actinomycetota bacterium]